MTLSAHLAAVLAVIAGDIKALFVATNAATITSLAFRPEDMHLILTRADGSALDAGVALVPFDDYSGSEYLPDQISTGAILTFTFSAPVQQVWIEMTSSNDADTARVRIDGGDPTGSVGEVIHAGQAQPMTGTTSAVKVLAPAGTTLTVYARRR